LTPTFCLFLLGNEITVPPVVFLFLTGFLLIAAGCISSIRKDLIADVPDDSCSSDGDPDVTTPRTLPRDLTHRIELTTDQKREFLDCYQRQYTDQHVWPDIKLEAFACDVQSWRPGRPITVYFAQRRLVREFAAQNGLKWLTEQLMRESRSFDGSNGVQKEKETQSVSNTTDREV
jgi:hypothetical protein